MLLCVGTSHRFVSVRVLEHAGREAALLRSSFAATAAQGKPGLPFTELVVVATCNRVELYVVCDAVDAARALALLRGTIEGSGEDTQVYVHRGLDAVRHLCRVAAGLDSLVLGEPQIAGQVAQAFAAIVCGNGVGMTLPKVAAFVRAVSRRARAQTAIARGPVSISSVAIRLATERLAGLAGKRVLVLGAGKISGATCEVLRTSGAHVTVANRTLARARALAQRVGAVAMPLQPMAELLAVADTVIASTASPAALIDRQVVDQALRLRVPTAKLSPLLLIDIAVPCNVAADVRGMSDVELIGIDDLRTRISSHLEERRAEIPRVEAIIEEELARFTGASAVPV